jgi:hypothetical protein
MATTKTDDRMFCRDCRCIGHANIVADAITCAECSSADVIDVALMRHEDQKAREAMEAGWDAYHALTVTEQDELRERAEARLAELHVVHAPVRVNEELMPVPRLSVRQAG